MLFCMGLITKFYYLCVVPSFLLAKKREKKNPPGLDVTLNTPARHNTVQTCKKYYGVLIVHKKVNRMNIVVTASGIKLRYFGGFRTYKLRLYKTLRYLNLYFYNFQNYQNITRYK